ncbi:MAG: hypothetical protein WCD49_03685 [Candidatus Acidiferrales bacterium]
MPEFKGVMEDFNTTLDALRDFVAYVGPVLTQRQEQTMNAAGKTAARFHVASLLTDENDLETSDIEDGVKQSLIAARSILTGAMPGIPADKISEARNKIMGVVPVKIVDGKIQLDCNDPATPELIAHDKAIEKLRKEIRLLRESALMALTSRSEWFVAQLIHLYFDMHPEAAGMSEPFFSLDALTSLQTIDDARDVLIDHKVESIMRLSFEDWLLFFGEKLKLGLSYLQSDKSRLAEIFKRRNLIVHNGGRVSRKYLKEVDAALSAGLKPGDLVEIAPDYLNASIDLIEHQFILVGAELWKKLEPTDPTRGSLLSSLAVQCLTEQRWMTARGFSYFGMNDKNQSEANRLYCQVNYWQSFKWSGQYDEIRDEVEKADFSAKGPLYQLAHAALTDDFECFFSLLPRVLDSGELLKAQLTSWPLFQGMRLDPRFAPFCPTISDVKIDGESGPN